MKKLMIVEIAISGLLFLYCCRYNGDQQYKLGKKPLSDAQIQYIRTTEYEILKKTPKPLDSEKLLLKELPKRSRGKLLIYDDIYQCLSSYIYNNQKMNDKYITNSNPNGIRIKLRNEFNGLGSRSILIHIYIYETFEQAKEYVLLDIYSSADPANKLPDKTIIIGDYNWEHKGNYASSYSTIILYSNAVLIYDLNCGLHYDKTGNPLDCSKYGRDFIMKFIKEIDKCQQ